MSPIDWFQLTGHWLARRRARLLHALGIRWLFFWSLFGVKEARQQSGATSAPSLETARGSR
jgi:hypothetical protein